MTYLFDLRGQRLFRTTCDLAHELVELALAEHTIAFTLELEWGRARDDRLAHRARRTIGRPTHSWPSAAHVHRRRCCDVEVAWNRHLGVIKLFAFPVAKVALALL
jgi:uncharacterized protein YbjT (DUF2867 family)